MRKAAKQIGAAALLLIVFCALCRVMFAWDYIIRMPLYAWDAHLEPGQQPTAEAENPDVVTLGEPRMREGYVEVPVFAQKQGSSFVTISDGQGKELGSVYLVVSRLRTIYDKSTGGFSGDRAVMIAVTVFWLLISAIMAWHFVQKKGPDFYQHYTVYYAGFSIFALIAGLSLTEATARHLLHPESYNMWYVYSAVSLAGIRIMQITTPLFTAFALALAVSNVALLRHMRPRIQNVLGLLASLLLILGEAMGWYLYSRPFVGSETELRIHDMLINTYATAFVYGECMLTGSVICSVLAAKHRPEPDADFIIILGCWFRQDGTLPPLLRGRVDKALEFWRAQKEKTGKAARFIPSGGKGFDEPMPEGEAMRRYLLEQQVPEELILTEPEALNTYQNMEKSLEIIREVDPAGKAVFATTNYHVFRSGVWAGLAGLPAEGMGSRTKWWFWPNAFLRETAGLLQKRWKQEVLMLIILLIYFNVLSMILA